jgi:hypothetical protein
MTKSKSDYKQLTERLEAYQDGKRCGAEFMKLCDKLRNLGRHEANFKILLEYFLPDHLLFDHLSGIEAINNDESLRRRLAWLTDNEVAENKADAIKELNDRNKALSPEELHKILQQRDREFLAKYGKKKPGPEVTREAFMKATRAERQKWVDQYTFDGLNEHWRQQAEESEND